MSDPSGLTLRAVAWLIALALAAAAGGVLFGLSTWRRAQTNADRLAAAEDAASELCDALRSRISTEIEHARTVLANTSSTKPL